MQDFSFSYKLTGHGWAECTVMDGDDASPMRVSYLSDALGDLVRAVLSLFESATSCVVECEWTDEPGEYHWRFTRIGDSVHVQITEQGTTRLEADTPGDDRDEILLALFEGNLSHVDIATLDDWDEAQHVLFEGDVLLIDIATQVEREMAAILDEYGVAGYKEDWIENDFPSEEYMRLCALIGSASHAVRES